MKQEREFSLAEGREKTIRKVLKSQIAYRDLHPDDLAFLFEIIDGLRKIVTDQLKRLSSLREMNDNQEATIRKQRHEIDGLSDAEIVLRGVIDDLKAEKPAPDLRHSGSVDLMKQMALDDLDLKRLRIHCEQLEAGLKTIQELAALDLKTPVPEFAAGVTYALGQILQLAKETRG